jgi:DNA (cytosine-5)-methyltransferase 1
MERKYPNPRPLAIDLFCGAGGLSLGLEQAGFDVALGVDLDGHHVATHERNFPYGKSLCTSIVDLDGKQIREAIGTDREIDLLAGGPPCQGFSFMGLRDLKDPRNSLIDHYVRIALEIRPKAFVMENVPGLMAGDTRSILEKVIKVLQANDYNVTLPVRILNAADFGVPQQRRRLFVLAIRRDVGEVVAYPEGRCPGQPNRPTVLEAIADLPNVEKYESLFKKNEVRYTRDPASHYARVARGIEVDTSDLSRPRTWDSTVCTGCLRIRHSQKSVELYAATPPGETVPGHKLPRLDPNGICSTLRAGSDSTHGSYTAPRPIHPILPRCITAREAARLHGFSDWFAFYPLKWHSYRQIGNAVCPPVARAIGYEVRKAIGGKTSSKAPRPVVLGSSFVLPEDRPRTLKRIPTLKQFSPVIAYLFDKAYDSRRKRLRKATFDFADVQEAINATGVNLHWVRADTFLSEIGRSRRVNEMLASALTKGYSVIQYTEGGAVGKFVQAGTPGTLEEKETLQIRIDEIHGAEALRPKCFDFNGGGKNLGRSVIAVLSEPVVQQKLWRTQGYTVSQIKAANSAGNGSGLSVLLSRPHGARPKTTFVLVCKTKTLPKRSSLSRLAQEHDCDSITVLALATSKHLVALRFDGCQKNPKEVARAAFELN